jgi:uncharacterized membrane protein
MSDRSWVHLKISFWVVLALTLAIGTGLSASHGFGDFYLDYLKVLLFTSTFGALVFFVMETVRSK